MSPRRVVITGLGPVTPLGVGCADFWNALLEGRSAVRRIQSFDPGRFDSQIGSEIDGLNIANHVPKSYRKAGKIMARDIVLAVAAAHHAVLDSGLRTKCLVERGEAENAPLVNSSRFGANIGAGLICADLPELAEALFSATENGEFSMAKWGAEGMQSLTPLWLLKFLPNMLACHVTIVHDAHGPSNTITCGEASSHLAIGEAFGAIARGVADVCICGGAESKTNPMALMRQSLGKRLSRNNDDPAHACRPFNAERDGAVVSEGGGLVILEELEHARARNARIYCELVGFGASNSAQDPNPLNATGDGRGIALAARKAMKHAGIGPEQLDLVATAACGQKHADATEAQALRLILGQRLSETPVMNIKGALGNNGAGSGAIDFIAAILALHNQTIPAMINGEADPAMGLRCNAKGPTDARVEYALSNGYALRGGQNASLVIRRYRA